MTDQAPFEPVGPDDLGHLTVDELDKVALYAYAGADGIRPAPDDIDLRPAAPHGTNLEWETDASQLYGG